MVSFLHRAVDSTAVVSGRRRNPELRWGLKVISAGLFSFLLATSISFPVLALCPEAAQIEAKVERLTQRSAEVLAVRPSALPGLCEVVVRSDSKTGICYTDERGTHFFFGNLIDAVTGINLTEEALSVYTRLTDLEMEELASLTAFSIGNDTAAVLYYVTDPQCPYCKRGVDDLKKLVGLGNLKVRFLLFPLQSHKGAMEQCVSVVCDRKGLEDFENGYRSENQCEEGRVLVESTVNFLKDKGISSTSTYIFNDGRFHSGLLKMPDLQRWLRTERPAEKAPVPDQTVPKNRALQPMRPKE